MAARGSPGTRQVGTRAFGRAVPGIDVRVVDDADRDVPDGTPGEMVLRHSAAMPRRGCFSGYLKDEAATEAGWRGGWFHTGDTVKRSPDGMLHFVDRKKHIIRRSGENIAAAEVEAILLTHPDVRQAAVMAVKDEVREEEVLACIVPMPGAAGGAALAAALFEHCNARLAYFKAPGWVLFLDRLPTTGTQKVQKTQIFTPGEDPRLDAAIEAQLKEADSKKRTQMIHDIQRSMPENMIAVPVRYQSAGFGVVWPWVGNAGAVRGGAVPSSETWPHYWFDRATWEKTKP